MAKINKRKKFFNVDIPIINRQTQLYAFDIKELEGRDIKYDLTRLLNRKNVLLRLKTVIKGDDATSIPVGIEIMSSFLRKVVRKGTDYIEDSFSAESKDSILRIKPLLVTRAKVSKQIRKILREKAKEELIKYVKSKNSEEIFEEILKNRFQKELSLKLKKIYPLSFCDIRIIKVEKFLNEEKKSK
ncbi:MAG: hypothetical protein Q8O84_04925 [Nanoarchaeota archaeon]|nr:hypothetical protein [Nanoarchaeota archaeon]